MKPIFALLGGASFCTFGIRFALNPLASVFIASEYAFTAAQRTWLLSAFFPGYILSMIPGGLLASHVGGKAVYTGILASHAALALAIPAAARAGPGALWGCLCALGLCQGPLFGAQKQLQAGWLPTDGGERARALMVVGLGSKLAGPVTNVAVPWLAASALGWRGVARLYGGMTAVFAVLWQLLVSAAPPPQPPPVAPAAALEPDPEANRRRIELGIFRIPSVYAPGIAHIAENASVYSILQLSPLVFTEVLGVPAAQLGRFLAVPPAINAVGGMLVPELERVLHRRGWPMLTIQKAMTGTGSAIEAGCQVLFALAQLVPAWRSPVLATVACSGTMVGHLLQWSGFYQNYHDVGGPQDTALLFSVWNTVANLAGVAVPAAAAFFWRRTGSYAPVYLVAAAMQVVGGALFLKLASVQPARHAYAELVAARRRAGDGWLD
jgi:hypothetical protein